MSQLKYISADYILPISSAPIADGVIVINSDNVIEEIGTKEDFMSVDIQYYKGVLLPGLINTHCHLELSHMKDICPTGTGLVQFVTKVVQLRESPQEEIQASIKAYDESMWAAGIQAVGDISNKIDTAYQKSISPIAYYTFVEMFDMMQPALTRDTVENYRAVFAGQDDSGKNKKSFVPHAPYSVTPELFAFINKANSGKRTISIHNSETPGELSMFRDGKGDLKSFFESLGINLDHFKPTGKASIDFTLEHMSPKRRNLFVHNTLTTKADIVAAQRWSKDVYWCTCPNANLYIENKLPDYNVFLDNNAKLTLGTDSIMSNWQLDIWEEIKTIKKYQSYVSLDVLLKAATINGAQALGYHKSMGTLEVGKSPGVVHVDVEWHDEKTDISQSSSKRVI